MIYIFIGLLYVPMVVISGIVDYNDFRADLDDTLLFIDSPYDYYKVILLEYFFWTLSCLFLVVFINMMIRGAENE